MSEGFDERDIEAMTEVYLKVTEGKKEEYIDEIGDYHPVIILLKDHEEIHKIMSRLELIVNSEQSLKYVDYREIKGCFMDFKTHNYIEEKTILKILKENGKRGRVNLIINEHRAMDNRFNDLIRQLEDGEITEYKQEFYELSHLLNDHTVMENNYLYPVALELIEDWEPIKNDFDQIREKNLKDKSYYKIKKSIKEE